MLKNFSMVSITENVLIKFFTLNLILNFSELHEKDVLKASTLLFINYKLLLLSIFKARGI